MDNNDNSISLMVGDGKTNVNNLPDLLLKNNLSNATVANDILVI
jgi:hypothetical protein